MIRDKRDVRERAGGGERRGSSSDRSVKFSVSQFNPSQNNYP